MNVIPLSTWDLVAAASLVLLLAALSWRLKLGQERQLLIAAARSVVQLTLLGLVLKVVFAQQAFGWVALIWLVMLAVAGWEVLARQKRRYRGWWSYGIGSASMFLSSFSITVLALAAIINVEPWNLHQYSIPLLWMLLGNTIHESEKSFGPLTMGREDGTVQ